MNKRTKEILEAYGESIATSLAIALLVLFIAFILWLVGLDPTRALYALI